ncbi:sensor histidine kinase [Candidatus Woesearchaeota archaeon]|nr:sensor histidine kinase [Candidatus Woesearchaeota archaeon]
MGLSLSYLASGGDERFLSSIPASQLEHLLWTPSERHVTNLSVAKGKVMNPEYTAFYQEVKNARLPVNFRYARYNGLGALHYEEKGDGIIDVSGQPLPPERFVEIFKDFTTKRGGGFGLKSAHRLIELRRGYIDVVSAPQQGPVIAGSTRTNSYVILPDIGFKGVRFDFYFPDGVKS